MHILFVLFLFVRFLKKQEGSYCMCSHYSNLELNNEMFVQLYFIIY